MIRTRIWKLIIVFGVLVFMVSVVNAQSVGSSGSIEGVVKDPSGGVVIKATVEITDPVSGFHATTTTDQEGRFEFPNVPFNPYHLVARAAGFADFVQDVTVRSLVPVQLSISLKLAGSSTTVNVEGEASDLIETTPTTHTDVDRTLINQLPVESSSSALSSVITLATPGVAADSNGLFHPLGEHAEVSYSVDGQPITDQQSKVFSNQLPVDAIQSMEVVSGIPSAKYGDKTSLVVRATTRSGLGQRQPHGDVTADYGAFGTGNLAFNFGMGGNKWGNFLTASGLESGRFLDTPEFSVLHAKGNSQNVFDRVDYQPGPNDSIHLNLNYSRSWFQIPNTYDQTASGQDQRQLMQTISLAPAWTHVIGTSTVFALNTYFRQDRVHYFPSNDLFSDQPATLAQTRHLTNAGFRSDLSYVHGIHNLTAGVEYSHYSLLEQFNVGLTDPTFNAVCLNPDGSPSSNASVTDPNSCGSLGSGFSANPNFLPSLLPFDLTRGGSLLDFNGARGINEAAVFLQDDITKGNWAINLGLRGDVYRGISSANAAEPRFGLAYNIKKTNTVLRLGYGRFLETPYNENLILSSSTGVGGLSTTGLGAFGEQPILPGHRNQFVAGFQQGFGRYLVVDAQYFWKYTHNAYDFDVLFNTPLAFPIMWRKSKVDGFGIRMTMPNFHGVTAYAVLGHARSRFFGPETGGIIFNSPTSAGVFRIDHDQVFQQTAHVQYQPRKDWPWIGLTWSYESGLVAGAVPDFATALTFDGDQQAAIGLYCGNQFPTLMSPLSAAACANQFPQGATRVRIPAPGTVNADFNPPRIAPRNLFDAAVGIDNLFHGDRYRWSLRFTVVNLTNKAALYNFLSTFSGTHFVSPRTLTAEVGFHF